EVASGRSARRVLEVKVEVGELTMINSEQLVLAFNVISKDTVAEGAKVDVKVVKAKARCTQCGEEWELKSNLRSMPYLMIPALAVLTSGEPHNGMCPKCGGNNFEIVSGKELIIRSIKVET
ncbi:MAG: hydrogenase maturation nickel metallochaperone HypA, partial [Thermoproteota archaeon]